MPGLQGVLLGMGNPLLDVSAVVDQAFLDKYGVSGRVKGLGGLRWLWLARATGLFGGARAGSALSLCFALLT